MLCVYCSDEKGHGLNFSVETTFAPFFYYGEQAFLCCNTRQNS